MSSRFLLVKQKHKTKQKTRESITNLFEFFIVLFSSIVNQTSLFHRNICAYMDLREVSENFLNFESILADGHCSN